MDKKKILAAAKTELHRHVWDTFVDHPPSVAQGGKGVVVTGCTACKKRANAGTPLPAFQAQMRHADIKTTLRVYAHVIPQSQRDAIESAAISTAIEGSH
jgi:hypothetical protein